MGPSLPAARAGSRSAVQGLARPPGPAPAGGRRLLVVFEDAVEFLDVAAFHHDPDLIAPAVPASVIGVLRVNCPRIRIPLAVHPWPCDDAYDIMHHTLVRWQIALIVYPEDILLWSKWTSQNVTPDV